MDVHYFDEDGLYRGTRPARRDPEEPGEVYLIPKMATTVAPPAVVGDTVRVWDGSAWSLTVDHRGEEYYLPDGSFHTITSLGEIAPEGATETPPPPPPPTPQEIEDELDRVAELIASVDPISKALFSTMFEVLKAAKTGNFIEFNGVTDKPTFKAYIREKLR